MNLAPLPHPNDEPPGEIRPGGPTLLSVREGFFIAKRFLGINELSFLLAIILKAHANPPLFSVSRSLSSPTVFAVELLAPKDVF
jgi:hypothetical protein